jgi:hypothetical protein
MIGGLRLAAVSSPFAGSAIAQLAADAADVYVPALLEHKNASRCKASHPATGGLRIARYARGASRSGCATLARMLYSRRLRGEPHVRLQR